MTDIEHAKKYAEESISLAISMYNPKAEIIAETACLYGLTYKNDQLTKAKDILRKMIANQPTPSDMYDEADLVGWREVNKEAEQFLSEVEKND